MTTVQARTINDTKTTLGPQQLEALATKSRGSLITCDDFPVNQNIEPA
jgi:hypothetical protein